MTLECLYNDFNTHSACGGLIPLKSGTGLALGFNTLY